MTGGVIALMPTILIYVAAGRKSGTLISFLPLAVLITPLVLCSDERAVKENADSVRRRYKAGRVPIGKQ